MIQQDDTECAGSNDAEPVPGRVPWLQNEPLAAQVYARYIGGLKRQLECVRGAIGMRCHHEMPGLLRGRRQRIANLQAATAELAEPGKVAILRRALAAEQRRLERDTVVLQPFSNADDLPPPPAVQLLEEGDDNVLSGEEPEPGSLAADFAVDETAAREEACEALISDEASLFEGPPLEPMPGVMHGDAGQGAQDILAVHSAYPVPAFVNAATLEEAWSEDLPGGHPVVKWTVRGVSEVLTREDFRSLLPNCWLTTGPINLHTILLQVCFSIAVLT